MVIFLDLDGVINCEADWTRQYTVRMACVKSLAALVKGLNADIVLTSSWRTGWVREGKCTPQIENLKNMFGLHGMKISGRTASLGDRSQEIADYCHRHSITKYLILDDDLSLFTEKKRVYKVNAKSGLTDRDVHIILKRCKKGCGSI